MATEVVLILAAVIPFINSQVAPINFTINANRISQVNGSSATGDCSTTMLNRFNELVCLTPTQGVLFDGAIPKISQSILRTNPDWARNLLTINVRTKDAGARLWFSYFFQGSTTLDRIEFVMFNCPQWRIGVDSISFFTIIWGSPSMAWSDENFRENVTATSCDSFVRVCMCTSSACNATLPQVRSRTLILLDFVAAAGAQWIHLAEAALHFNATGCPRATSPSDTTVSLTTELDPTVSTPLTAEFETTTPAPLITDLENTLSTTAPLKHSPTKISSTITPLTHSPTKISSTLSKFPPTATTHTTDTANDNILDSDQFIFGVIGSFLFTILLLLCSVGATFYAVKTKFRKKLNTWLSQLPSVFLNHRKKINQNEHTSIDQQSNSNMYKNSLMPATSLASITSSEVVPYASQITVLAMSPQKRQTITKKNGVKTVQYYHASKRYTTDVNMGSTKCTMLAVPLQKQLSSPHIMPTTPSQRDSNLLQLNEQETPPHELFTQNIEQDTPSQRDQNALQQKTHPQKFILNSAHRDSQATSTCKSSGYTQRIAKTTSSPKNVRRKMPSSSQRSLQTTFRRESLGSTQRITHTTSSHKDLDLSQKAIINRKSSQQNPLAKARRVTSTPQLSVETKSFQKVPALP